LSSLEHSILLPLFFDALLFFDNNICIFFVDDDDEEIVESKRDFFAGREREDFRPTVLAFETILCPFRCKGFYFFFSSTSSSTSSSS